MKFIGQYIQQLIARFRSDVYLENISTSSETGVLVVDSDGKITKNTGISGGLASTVTVTDSTSSTNFPIVFHNESNGLLDSQQFEYNPAILTLSVSNINASSNITASNNLTSNGAFILNQNDNDAVGFITNAYKLRGASGVGQNSDHIFDLRANSRDGAGNATIYSRFLSKIVSVTDGSEQGDIDLIVMADGTLTSGFLITGQDDGTVDATIGSGTGSLTTIAGDLAITGGNITNAVTFDSGLTGTLTGSSTSCTGQAATVATIAGLAPNTATTAASQPNITTLAGVFTGSANQLVTDDGDGTVTSESNLTFDPSPSMLGISRVVNNAHDTGILKFDKYRGAAGHDNDDIGSISFSSRDYANSGKTFAIINGVIEDAGSASSPILGEITLNVSNNNTIYEGLKVTGSASNAEQVDVTLGGSTNSVTTVRGSLTMGSTPTLDNNGNLLTNAATTTAVALASESTDTTCFPVFATTNTGNQSLKTNSGFTFNSATSSISTSGAVVAAGVVQGLGLIGGASGISSTSTNASASGPVLNLTKNRNGASAVNNDEAGEIQFNGVNDAGTPETIAYAQIVSSSAIVTDGDERGKLELKVANDGTLRNGITFLGTDTAQEVDVTIGNGSDSLTTIAGDITVTGDIISSKITTSAEQSFLAGNLSIGAHNDEDRIYLARYSNSYPHAHIFCGLDANDVTTGFKIVTKNGGTYSDAFVINGSNKAATFSGSVTATGNINANGNIVGDGSTSLTSINQIGCNTVIATAGVISQGSTGIVSSSSTVGTIKDTDIGTAAYIRTGGITELVFFGTVYAGGNLTPGKVYYLTEDSSTSGAASWRIANATNGLASAGKLLAIALSTTPSHGMLLRGAVVIESSILGNTNPGRTLFLKATDGIMDISPPSSTGNIQRILGHYIQTTATTSHSLIHFNPSQEFITIA